MLKTALTAPAAAVLSRIDHCLLRPSLTRTELQLACALARELELAAVSVLPWFVRDAVSLAKGSQLEVGTVIGFPSGGSAIEAKLAEARVALEQGATEIDFVINLSRLLSGEHSAVAEEIGAVTRLVHTRGAAVKVTFENCYLTDAHKTFLCDVSRDVGADWVKTSTGFGPGGSSDADVELMVQHVAPRVGVEAAGGIATAASAARLIELGARRIGTSQLATIARELGVLLP